MRRTLAPQMPASFAVDSTSPFLSVLSRTAANAAGPSSTRADAVARRAVCALSPTSTIDAVPSLSTCVRVSPSPAARAAGGEPAETANERWLRAASVVLLPLPPAVPPACPSIRACDCAGGAPKNDASSSFMSARSASDACAATGGALLPPTPPLFPHPAATVAALRATPATPLRPTAAAARRSAIAEFARAPAPARVHSPHLHPHAATAPPPARPPLAGRAWPRRGLRPLRARCGGRLSGAAHRNRCEI